MNKDSMTTLQKGNSRNLSPVHIHLTDSTPLHVFLEKPVRPKPIYPKVPSKTSTKTKVNLKNAPNKTNNNVKDPKITYRNHKGTPENFDFGKSYGNISGEEKPDLMEFSQSQKLLKEKEHMLEEYKRRLTESEMENRKLVQNMEEICLDLEGRRRDSQQDPSLVDPDLSRLTNSQHFLQAMAIKMDDFGMMLRHFREERIPCVSNAELDALLTQKKILEHDLVTFDDVCIFLRREMRKMIESRSQVKEMMMEKDEVMLRLETLRESYESLKKNLAEAEAKVREAFTDLEGQKVEQTQSNTIIETLRMTKAHLQRELSSKEAECNKLSTKVKDLQTSLEREKQAREKMDLDKENLKKATRLHKNKASKNAETLEHVNRDLMSKEAEIKDLTQQLTSLRLQMSQVATEKLALAAELSEAKLKLVHPSKYYRKETRLNSENEESDCGGGHDDDLCKTSNRQLSKTSKKVGSDIEKDHILNAEAKVSHAQIETSQLRLRVQEFESLLDDYKKQVMLSREDAERYRAQVDELRKELLRTKSDKEIETSKSSPDDLIRALSDNQIENQKIFSDRIEMLDKRIITLEEENRELAILNGKREEALHQTNLRLEEKITENSALQRQLDTLMADFRRMKDSEKDRIAAAERSNQIHILELEGHLSQLKHDTEKLKREKEEIERRMNQKLYDLQDELKQSHSTNRALQNFIQFLKNSYNATFDQPSLGTFSSIPNLASLGR